MASFLQSAYFGFMTPLVSMFGEAIGCALALYICNKILFYGHVFFYDYMSLSGKWEKYRVQPGTQPSPAMLDEDWKNAKALQGHLNEIGMYLIYYNLFKRVYGMEVMGDCPSLFRIVRNLVLHVLTEETCIYWGHYALHKVPGLYRFHKRHHEYKVTTTMAAYHDTFESFILQGFGGTFLGALLFRFHFVSYLLGQMASIFRGINNHCGFELPWHPLNYYPFAGAQWHDAHHSRNVGNYGSWLMIWDSIMGTTIPDSEWKLARSSVHASDPEWSAKRGAEKARGGMDQVNGVRKEQ